MSQADSTTPMRNEPESNRSNLQSLAERVGLLVPGASLTHQQLAFAEGVIELVTHGQLHPEETK